MSDPIYSIYKITNKLNGKSYIGFTGKTPPEKRWKDHIRNSKTKSRLCCYLQRTIAKYGSNIFSFEIIYQSLEYEHTLKIMEPKFILQFSTLSPTGYNLTLGGEGIKGHRHSEETKRKISSRIISDETKKRISNSRMGITPWNKGIHFDPLSPEMRKKIGEKLRGRKFSDEHRRKIGQKNRGRFCTEETKQKMRISSKLRWTPEAKLAASIKKKSLHEKKKEIKIS